MSSKVKGITNKPHWEANVAAMWGQMSTGGGHSTLSETMAVLSAPIINKSYFISTEKRMVGCASGGINEISWSGGA